MVIDMDEAVDELCAKWGALVARARIDLNGMFKPEDYPTVDQLRSRYTATVRTSVIPKADFRNSQGLTKEQRDELIEDYNTQVNVSLQEGVEECFDRMQFIVGHFADLLHAEGRFKINTLDNILTVADRVKNLNITDNAQIAEFVERMSELSINTDHEAARKDDVYRASLANEATVLVKDITDAMGGF
jgi:hypothetical protein